MRCSHNCQQCTCTASNAHVRLQVVKYLNISGLVIAFSFLDTHQLTSADSHYPRSRITTFKLLCLALPMKRSDKKQNCFTGHIKYCIKRLRDFLLKNAAKKQPNNNQTSGYTMESK